MPSIPIAFIFLKPCALPWSNFYKVFKNGLSFNGTLFVLRWVLTKMVLWYLKYVVILYTAIGRELLRFLEITSVNVVITQTLFLYYKMSFFIFLKVKNIQLYN